MRPLSLKKRKIEQDKILRYRLYHEHKNLTLRERSVAKWIGYLTCSNGMGVNLVKVDGLKMLELEPGSIHPFRQRKLKVNFNEVAEQIMSHEPDLFYSLKEIEASLFSLYRKGVIEIHFHRREVPKDREDVKTNSVPNEFHTNVMDTCHFFDSYAFLIKEYY